MHALTRVVRLPGHQAVPLAQLAIGEEPLARHPLRCVHHAAEGGLHRRRALLRGLGLHIAEGRAGPGQAGSALAARAVHALVCSASHSWDQLVLNPAKHQPRWRACLQEAAGLAKAHELGVGIVKPVPRQLNAVLLRQWQEHGW